VLLAAGAGLATVGLAIGLLMRPGDRNRAFEAYVLCLGALGVVALSQTAVRSFPAPTASRLQEATKRRRKTEPRVPELERLERELEMAMESAYDTYFRLRPTLREIAASRLALSGVELDRPDGRAEALLGPDLWALVRPDLARPSDHRAAGLRLPEIERAVEALEGLRT
jgi:hypothetical protein